MALPLCLKHILLVTNGSILLVVSGTRLSVQPPPAGASLLMSHS